jgi:hypothetical protein
MGWTPLHYVSASKFQTDTIYLSGKLAEESDIAIKRVVIDLAKQVFQIHGVESQERWCYANNYAERNYWITLKICRPA